MRDFARAHNDYLDYDRWASAFGDEEEADDPTPFAAPYSPLGIAAEIRRIHEQAGRQGDVALLLSGNGEALRYWNFALDAEVALKAMEREANKGYLAAKEAA